MSVVEFRAPSFPASAVVENVRRHEAEHAATRRNAGYRDGFEQGLADAQREIDDAVAEHRASAERLTALADALDRAVQDLGRRDTVQLADVDADLVTLAVELAEGIVGRELEVTSEPVIDAMARALELKPDRGTPVVRVHPDDEATAREAAAADLVRWSSDVVIMADSRVERGGCVVDVASCRIDAQVGPAIDRLRHHAVTQRD